MKFANGVSRLDKIAYVLSTWFERVAIIGFLGMLASTVVDVVGSKLFHWPLPVGTESVYLFQIVAIAGAMAFSQIDGRHIRVEFLVDKMPPRVGATLKALAALLGLALFIILTWRSFAHAQTLLRAGEVTSTSRIPVYPFAFWLMLSCIPLCLVLLGEMLRALIEVFRR